MTGSEFFMSIVASVIGGMILLILAQNFNKYRKTKYLHNILNFGQKKILFIFQYKQMTDVVSKILPSVSSEDFIAMNNFISALIKINFKYDIELLSTKRFFDQTLNNQAYNIVTFGSRKINRLTDAVEKILEFNKINFYRLEEIESSNNRWRIIDNNGRYVSNVDEEIERHESIKDTDNIGSYSFKDKAYITKITNPWDSESMVMIIAGIKGIGTWGAAECIKKWSSKINEKLSKHNRKNSFSALVNICYKNYDIVDIEVINIHIIDNVKLNLPE